MKKNYLTTIMFLFFIIFFACEAPIEPEDSINSDIIELNWIVYTYSQEVWFLSEYKDQFPDINRQYSCDKIELYLSKFFIKYQINDTCYVKEFVVPDKLYWSEKD